MHLHREKQMDASYQALARHSPYKALYWSIIFDLISIDLGCVWRLNHWPYVKSDDSVTMGNLILFRMPFSDFLWL